MDLMLQLLRKEPLVHDNTLEPPKHNMGMLVASAAAINAATSTPAGPAALPFSGPESDTDPASISLDTASDTEDGTPLPIFEGAGAISFDNVVFSYPNTTGLQLKGVSFDVSPGETVALVGASGSGKSTCLPLVTRLHDATDGRVLLNGVDVRDMPLSELRNRIGVVSQDTVRAGPRVPCWLS